MSGKKISKSQAEEEINEFFSHLENKTSKDMKKIKKLAMKHKIKLGDKKKLFCKKCLNPYKDPSIRIKNDMISIVCDSCEHRSRWKFKGELNFGIKHNNEEDDCC
ncbi:hypothetical protein COU59_01975 [Candidatus Pacearchaeota archaeon CG10_big_fil_rev_8_21_14_0_10_34_12]|nr:MAG: hypothetical protein COU59_01975 [Candidatus Pacearchaeota archaeon CG10_big_fil_rev_8_21_14_0_10_34_12]